MARSRVGRPPEPGITDALRKAAERIMIAEGYSRLSIDRLANEVGTTRPTFYRRYPTLAHLMFEVVRDAFGTGEHVDTGSLRDDLLALQRNEVTMFASPLLMKNFAGILEAVRIDPAVGTMYQEQFVQPRRENVARILQSAVVRGDIDLARVDFDLVCDLLTGPILARALLPVGAANDDRFARQTVDVVLTYLRAATAEAAGA